MANLTPFRGVLYNPAVVKDVSKVVAPPYDIIDADYQKALYDRHPHNVIRLELGIDQPNDSAAANRYTRAATFLKEWMARDGALKRDAQPAFYLYMVDYRPPSGDPGAPPRVLKGFFSTVELEEFGSGKIFPHENTRSAAKADRLNLLQACRANFSPIFSLYSDPDNRVMRLLEKSVDLNHPPIDFHDDAGLRQRLWTINDPAVLHAVCDLMKPKPLFIADGHHRYETSLRYRQLRREQAGDSTDGSSPQSYDRVLMLCASLEDPGLTVLPTHRVLTHALPDSAAIKAMLSASFEWQEISFRPSEKEARTQFLQALRSHGQSGTAFGLALREIDTYVLLTLRSDRRPPPTAAERDKLDVSILQQEVIARLCPTAVEQEAMVYTKDDREALDLVQQGKATGALLLNATKVGEVRAVAESGGRMPHKSTYFFPKQLTGLVINVMEP